ncbi:hypothetical protein [Ornithinibacillus californiensis]|uniref:hypothetical protein n=1 Tax=Ornithinibacillus californiensis TaxID=161536 RepID=UPI00064D90DE|nr:hypothetical protein [Ornithinibacillus californiensis]
MGRKERQITGNQKGLHENEVQVVVERLGKLKDVKRENYISSLILRSDREMLAASSMDYLRNLTESNPKILDEAKAYYLDSIDQISKQLHNNLSPMEIRFIFTQIADLRFNLNSMRRYWLLRLFSGMNVLGGILTGAIATLLIRKKNK